ncbi:MAG: YggS family pyridoxal phosphate-dependent enzyme [Candidatus Aegiribacteria sp.]|nr:YggS family pyridoxal phosphate-dependent enzyme [Candidatus Aegiribacteria sp.]
MNYSIESIKSNFHRAGDMIAEALNAVHHSPRVVRIMAVTKTHPVELVQLSIEAGIRIIGENRVSEGGRKIKTLGKEVAEFHMIGPIHTGEVRQAVRDFHWIDSICRMKIAEEIAKRTTAINKKQPGILVEVNTSGEESKHGLAPEYSVLEEALGQMRELGLVISGLLTIGPLGGTEEETRKAFASLRNLRDDLSRKCGFELPELSMGMSDDFQLAVMEGSTIVRLGRFLFGRRQN